MLMITIMPRQCSKRARIAIDALKGGPLTNGVRP
ncbi:Uncharacterised protein [Bordetella holmesii]|nr:Uncharacterised protein [Bordetella holmesii]